MISTALEPVLWKGFSEHSIMAEGALEYWDGATLVAGPYIANEHVARGEEWNAIA